MPVIASHFQPPVWLANGHVQTILPVLLPRRVRVPFIRERIATDDGDFLELDWLRAGHERIAVLSHGLEGNSQQLYIRALARVLTAAGWDVLAWNFRGCGSEPNRLVRFYHSGETGDLRTVIASAAREHSRVALVGFSLGGNVTLKYLGEAAPHPAVVAGVGISVPIDLGSCARKLDQRFDNQIYLRRFLSTMITKIEAKARQFPEHLNARGARRIASFEEFDGRFTGPIHGFRDADDYWTRSSARQFLPNIPVPTLLLNARNDPFLTPACFPEPEAEANARLFLEAPESGGHVGFLDLKHGIQPWWEQRVAAFLEAQVRP